MSAAAAACPHCGYPLTPAASSPTPASPAVVTTSVADLDALGTELAADVSEALRQAGFDPTRTGPVRIGSVTVERPAGGGVPPVSRFNAATTWGGYSFGYDYKSKWTLLGLPLLAMSKGFDPATGRKRVAKGWVAVGDVAVGLLAVGGAAFGGVCLGGVAVGVVSLGGLAVGLAFAMGGAAIGTVAVGGLAIGLYAAGGGAFGLHALGATGMH